MPLPSRFGGSPNVRPGTTEHQFGAPLPDNTHWLPPTASRGIPLQVGLLVSFVVKRLPQTAHFI